MMLMANTGLPKQFSKYINPGLELYRRRQLALDSEWWKRYRLKVYVYDTRSSKETLARQLNKPEMDSVSFIIAHCTSNEIKLLADAGLKRNIPVINVE